jgi:hypothetical protein
MVSLRQADRIQCGLFAALTLTLFAGCGGEPKYQVTGKVTLADGSPFAGAVVDFAAKDGIHSAAALVQADGTFVVSSEADGDGARPGAYRVRIIPPEADETGNEDDDDPNYRRRKRPQMLRKYQSFDTSGLEFTVSESGENNFDIKLENLPDRPARTGA